MSQNLKPNRFVTLDMLNDFTFAQLPLQFSAPESQYYGMELGAKYMYALLLSRLSLSKKNEWVNDEGEVYCLYSAPSLSRDLNLSLNTIRKLYDQLEAYGLVKTVERKGLASHVYVALPDLEDGFICEPKKEEEESNTEAKCEGVTPQNLEPAQNLGANYNDSLKALKDFKEEEELSELLAAYRDVKPGAISKAELNILKNLSQDHDLHVIKLAIHRAIGKNCPLNYIKKVLTDWQVKQLKNAEEVTTYVSRFTLLKKPKTNTKKSSQRPAKVIREEKVPSWLSESIQNPSYNEVEPDVYQSQLAEAMQFCKKMIPSMA